MPVPLPQGKNIGTGVGVGWGSTGSDWRAPWVSIRWSRLSSQVLFGLLFSPEVRYSAQSYFTTEIIFQVRCAREFIPYYAALGIRESLATGPHTLSSCLVRLSMWQKLFSGLYSLFIPGIHSEGNAACIFINAAGVATSPWQHSYKRCGRQLIFHFSAVRRSWQETSSNV